MTNKRFAIGAITIICLSFLFFLVTMAKADAQTKPFRLCTGSSAGNYFRAAQHLKKTSTSVPIEVVESQGSMDNLDKMLEGKCDGAFVQSDALLVFADRNAQSISAIEPAGVLYDEHAHLLCNRSSGISRVVDLRSNHTVAVGPDGSGARTTWEAFKLADKKLYAPVKIDTRSGVRALSAVASGDAVQCALWVGALGSAYMKGDASQHGDRIVLVGTDDRDMTKNAKDGRGQPVYSYGEIPSGTYPRIQPGGTLYGTKPVATIKLTARFVASLDWINKNERAYDSILRAFAAAKPAITDMVTPK